MVQYNEELRQFFPWGKRRLSPWQALPPSLVFWVALFMSLPGRAVLTGLLQHWPKLSATVLEVCSNSSETMGSCSPRAQGLPKRTQSILHKYGSKWVWGWMRGWMDEWREDRGFQLLFSLRSLGKGWAEGNVEQRGEEKDTSCPFPSVPLLFSVNCWEFPH